MNRALLLAAAGLIATGCYSSPAPVNEIDVYWEFTRNIPGAQPVLYTCGQAGVDTVTVTDLNGNPVGPSTLDCTLLDTNGNPVQGAAFANFTPGASYTFVVTGYRNGVSAPLFRGQSTITFTGGASQVTVTAAGVQGNLTTLFSFNGVTYPTCGGAGGADVQRFDFTLRDGNNTIVSSGSASCDVGNAPGVDYGPIDLDNYLLSVDAVRTSGGKDVIVGSICRQAFDHFGTSATVFDETLRFDLPNTICSNP